MNTAQLAAAARRAKALSVSPYSKFRVGAALLTRGGRLFTGCNIENSSFSLTICAERTALFKAISEGSRRFRALAIASDTASFVPPCGACRQVILDLAGDIEIILTDNRRRIKSLRMSELLPLPFGHGMLRG